VQDVEEYSMCVLMKRKGELGNHIREVELDMLELEQHTVVYAPIVSGEFNHE